MLIKESIHIKELIQSLNINKKTKILNVGSQNDRYLRRQTYISDNILKPIQEAGATIINFDLFAGKGVDIYGDIFEKDVYKKLRRIQPDIILLFNVLECVKNVDDFSRIVETLLPMHGYLIFSGPFKYPKHYDPIDNMFRPKPEEVAIKFTHCNMIKSEIIKDYTYIYYLFKSPMLLITTTLRTFVFFYKYKKWKEVVLPKFKWLFTNFEVSIAFLQKSRADSKVTRVPDGMAGYDSPETAQPNFTSSRSKDPCNVVGIVP